MHVPHSGLETKKRHRCLWMVCFFKFEYGMSLSGISVTSPFESQDEAIVSPFVKVCFKIFFVLTDKRQHKDSNVVVFCIA